MVLDHPTVSVPDIEVGCGLGPEGNGVSPGEGVRGGAQPPGGGKYKQSVLSMGRDNMGKERRIRQV